MISAIHQYVRIFILKHNGGICPTILGVAYSLQNFLNYVSVNGFVLFNYCDYAVYQTIPKFQWLLKSSTYFSCTQVCNLGSDFQLVCLKKFEKL